MMKVCDLATVDTIITDGEPSAALAAACREVGVEIVVV
jgi:DeoR/GlpR family transcriptional regulator of sugar metabolism